MAIDYGTKRIGIAISDEMRMLASPRGVIEAGSGLIQAISKLVESEKIAMVILGIPRTLSGGDSEMTKEVLLFKDKLSNALVQINVPLETRDERLTSIMAETNIRARELPKMKREKKSLRDEEAARILLQEYLDTK